jgi:predicted Zn finger-like uncharacterized protein
MLLTTCPNCGAKYKVSPEQLNVRQGRVMCGSCRHVFNAFEALERIQDAEVGEPIDYSVVASHRSEGSAPGELTVPAESIREAAPAVESPAAPQAPSAPAMEEEATQHPFNGDDERLKKFARAEPVRSPVDLRDFAESDAIASLSQTAANTASEPQRTEVAADVLLAPTLAALDPPKDPPAETPAETSSNTPPDSPTNTASRHNPLISGTLPQQSPPSFAWRWLAVLAAVIFLVQTLYYFRSVIVQQYPQLRPHFVAACGVIGCRVPWGQTQEALKIEASDLIERPGDPSRILLTASLVNRGATMQDFPALEVTLTDVRNNVLSSRVLMPAEYLGRTPAPEEGLAPNVALDVNLSLELVGNVPAAGYGLRLFYPA